MQGYSVILLSLLVVRNYVETLYKNDNMVLAQISNRHTVKSHFKAPPGFKPPPPGISPSICQRTDTIPDISPPGYKPPRL